MTLLFFLISASRSLSIFLLISLSPSLFPSIYLQLSLCICLSLSLSHSFSLFIFLFSFIFYFSTEKVPKIDRLLGKYKGREEEFLRFVYQKYGNRITIISLSIFLAACPVANKYHSDVIPNFSPSLSWIYYCLPYLYFFLLYPPSYLL